MARRKKFIRKPSKYEDEAVLYSSEVLEIIENNKEYPSGSIKNVFLCKSKTLPEGRMCVLWGRTCVEVGDEVDMKGRMVNNNGKEIFAVWSMLIRKRAKGDANERRNI